MNFDTLYLPVEVEIILMIIGFCSSSIAVASLICGYQSQSDEILSFSTHSILAALG